MRSSDPSLFILLILAALVADPASSQDVPPQDVPPQEASLQEVTEEEAPAPRRVVFRSEVTGFQIVLPEGWDGTSAVDEEGLPGRATYRFQATAAGMAGTTVVVERVTGLNPLVEERFRRGQVAFGYHGLRPTGALPADAMVFGPGAGVAIAAGERTGRAYFVQRGRVFWAVHIAAPVGVLAEQPGWFDAIARGVRLSEAEVEPRQES